MDFANDILPYLVSAVTGIFGWFAGKRKRDNDSLRDLQDSVCMLTDRNKELLSELIQIRGENAALKHNQESMMREIEQLRKENKSLHEEIEALNEKLSNVKSITRSK